MPKKPSASNQSPATAEPSLPSVKLSPRGAVRLKSGHLWVYRSDIAAADGVAPGAMVGVTDERGKFVGTALYSSSSQIAIRMLARDKEEITDLPALIAERIRAAIAYRKLVVAATDAYRIVFSEADFLPGLIVDRYNDVLSLQILTQAMDAEPVRGAIIETLIEELQPAGIVERVDPRIRDLEQLPPRASGLLWGKKSSTTITMNGATNSAMKPGAPTAGVRFHYDGLEGQKTGAFLDQRENYAAAARYAKGNALDVFCYQALRSTSLQSAQALPESTAPAPRWRSRTKTPPSMVAKLNGSKPTPSTSSATTQPAGKSTTPSFLIPPRSPKPNAISTRPAAAIKNSTCAP
jgi:23S rRNA (cytosine1962-C5)-methyltransferase